MFRSMTGFGMADIFTENGRFSIEITSLNKKFLDFSVFLPKEFSSFEIDIRKIISKKIFRGFIIFKMYYYPKDIQNVLPSIKLLKDLKKGFQKIQRELKIKEKEIDLLSLIEQAKSFQTKEGLNLEKDKDKEKEKIKIFQGIEKALKELISMKTKEGKTLLLDIKKRLKIISLLLLKIEKKAPISAKNFQKKLKLKLKEYSKDDERVLKEVVLFSEKTDITEEIIRLKSHIKLFSSFFQEKKIIGRKSEFLLQEMLREANTIASKAQDSQISTFVVNIKSELDKIKEQVQNVE